MFQVIETTSRYNRRGAVVSRSTRPIFASADPVECARYRYSIAKGGYHVSHNNARNVTVQTMRDGQGFTFAELILLVDGREFFDAVADGRAPAQDEASWVAAHA